MPHDSLSLCAQITWYQETISECVVNKVNSKPNIMILRCFRHCSPCCIMCLPCSLSSELKTRAFGSAHALIPCSANLGHEKHRITYLHALCYELQCFLCTKKNIFIEIVVQLHKTDFLPPIIFQSTSNYYKFR